MRDSDLTPGRAPAIAWVLPIVAAFRLWPAAACCRGWWGEDRLESIDLPGAVAFESDWEHRSNLPGGVNVLLNPPSPNAAAGHAEPDVPVVGSLVAARGEEVLAVEHDILGALIVLRSGDRARPTNALPASMVGCSNLICSAILSQIGDTYDTLQAVDARRMG